MYYDDYFNATCILPQSFSDETYFCTGPHKTDPKQFEIYMLFEKLNPTISIFFYEILNNFPPEKW